MSILIYQFQYINFHIEAVVLNPLNIVTKLSKKLYIHIKDSTNHNINIYIPTYLYAHISL